jgi:hypothetical protein
MDAVDRIKGEARLQLKAQMLDSANRRRMYAETFSTPQGKRVLLDLLTRAFTFSSTFTGNSQSYFNEGARAFALEIMAVIPGITGKVISGHLSQIEGDYEKELLKVEGDS